MMSAWRKSYPDGYTYRDLIAKEIRIDENHTVLILRHNDDIDSYVMWHDNEGHSTPFMFMFGHKLGSVPYASIVRMTVENAPDYYHLVEED